MLPIVKQMLAVADQLLEVEENTCRRSLETSQPGYTATQADPGSSEKWMSLIEKVLQEKEAMAKEEMKKMVVDPKRDGMVCSGQPPSVTVMNSLPVMETVMKSLMLAEKAYCVAETDPLSSNTLKCSESMVMACRDCFRAVTSAYNIAVAKSSSSKDWSALHADDWPIQAKPEAGFNCSGQDSLITSGHQPSVLSKRKVNVRHQGSKRIRSEGSMFGLP